MNVQLLLLLALAGPFCALTHASPTALPEDVGDEGDLPAVTEGPKLDLSLVTGAPAATEAAEVAQDQVVTDAAVEAEIEAETAAPGEAATAAPGEAATEAAPAVVLTEEPVADTEAPVASTAAAPEQLITEAPAVEAPAPTEEAEKEDPPVVPTSAAEVEEEVLYVEVEGLSSGQVAGIVIGALLAVVILIAVVIAAVRRMGKYSP
ncbi:podoplanin [Acanthopagrus schlegelii]